MADISDIVAGAVHDAEEGITRDDSTSTDDVGGDGGETSTEGGAGGGTEGAVAPATTTVVSPSSGAAAPAATVGAKDLGTAVAETPVPDDELTKELATFGIHAPQPGKREGLFKWSKVRKVVESARTKTAARFEKDLADRDTRLKTAEGRLKGMDSVDQLILIDPDRYIRTLAAIHPDKYGKFVNGSAGAAEAKKPEAAAAAPAAEAPEPDLRYEDGSMGYGPEGLKKLLAFTRDEAKREAVDAVKEMYEQRFGPIEKDWKAAAATRAVQQQREQRIPMVREQILNAKKTWGTLFQSKFAGDKEDDPEIVKTLDEHPDWTFDACVAHVLMPRMQANRENLRKELLEEINKAPAAAARSVPAGGGAGGIMAPRTTEDIVREAIAAANRGGV